MDAPDWLPRAAVAHPERVAVEAPDGALTYTELLDRACAATPERVIEARPGLSFAVGLHAALLRAAPVVPVDPRWTVRERDARLARAGDAPGVHVFTSGTTGAPKPVILSYDNLAWSALGSAVALGLDRSERWLCVLPLAHVGGLSILVRSAIYATTAVVHERFHAAEVVQALREHGITLVSLVPTMLARLLDAGLERPPDLRWALLGGAPTPPALLARAAAAGLPVVTSYGLTEACSQVATDGVPLPGVRVELAPDGEIVVSGPTVAGAGLLPTGDLGAWDEGGRLRVIGRKADTIITGGESVAPQEVEEVLFAHPGVADAAVVGRPDPEWGERLVALVVARDGAAIPPEHELRAFCAARLARFKVPKRFEAVPTLPRNAAGKLERPRLPA
jgi:O-succinylbenzoic acid--CoA ligase